ncbi:hypothetical protein CBP31_13050 [Oceanisphaera profunda]|uniref:Uncharacterized protein n=1 Tax=Oceanisphaera profunda TaxID=1416627 RepID=A0A1Y0D838_9GAMM|nr:hypothetical protein [Oceanisphaera profunda]ART83434.1 hypothetical protein CBP31_13050 [Oceanisphaera profunda]
MLILPNTPNVLPAELIAVQSHSLSAIHSASWKEVNNHCAALLQQSSYTVIVGASQTPAVYWLAALQSWPKANVWYWDGVEHQGQWQQLSAQTVYAAASGQLTTAQEQSPKTQSQPASNSQQSGDSDHVLLGKGFRFAAWGLSDKNNLQRLKDVEYQVSLQNNPELSRKLVKAVAKGKHAFELWQQCEQQLKEQGDSVSFAAWYQALYQQQNNDIQRHLRIQLEKTRNFRAKKQATQSTRVQYHSNVRGPDLEPHHPNSMAHLAHQPCWEVLIDETGCEFGEAISELAASDQKVGRMVALAVPGKQSILPPIALGYHATEVGHESNDAVVQSLLDAKVGILGFSVKDQNLPQAYSWFSAVHTLCRWVLRSLPIMAGQTVTVDFLIEERGNSQQDLTAVSELLSAELAELDAQRFAKLTVNMRFIKKSEHPYNGYVDVVAHTWGSPAAASKDRLKKSAWLGHCLLRPDDETLSRLLLALEGIALNRHDWLALMSHTNQLPEHSLAGNMLHKLGAQIQQTPALWHSYVSEVSQQLDNKGYQLSQLVPALSWLQRYQPSNETLPPILELQWLSGKLAISNHQGQLDMATVERCFTLCSALKQEDARRVSEVLLRLSVSATNSFQFALAEQVLNFLSDIPQLAMGVRNYGKLLSSRGQVAAFQGEVTQAQVCFDEALACFSQLSDPQQARQEQQQTQIYKLFAQLDDRQLTDDQLTDVLTKICQQRLDKDVAASLRSLAHSSQEDEQRWLHHVLLRAMCVRPALASKWLADYAAQAHQWQSGQYHPWPLINFYRAWLLLQLDQIAQAELYWQQAIDGCQQGGTTLQWMGHVLATVAQSLGSKVACLSSENVTELQHKAPELPVGELAQFVTLSSCSHQDRMHCLARCLPFNFH